MGLLAELLGFGLATVFVAGLVVLPVWLFWLFERDIEYPAASGRRRARLLVGAGAALSFFGLEFTIASMLWGLDDALPLGFTGVLLVGMGTIVLGNVPAFAGYVRVLQARS